MKKLLVTLTLAFSSLNAQDDFVKGIYGKDIDKLRKLGIVR